MYISRIAQIILIKLLLFGGLSYAKTEAQPYSIQFSLDNDLFNLFGNHTDRYFTNGLRIDYSYATNKFKFPSNLLLKISDRQNLFGVGLAQYIFTPEHIDNYSIQPNDRPYSGALFFIHSLHSINKEKGVSVYSEIYLGVLGPLSLANEAQTWVHELIDSTIPRGWDSQIPNDIVLNYNIIIDKSLIRANTNTLVSGRIESYNGSLYNAIGAGFTLKIGKYGDFLSIEDQSDKKVQLSFLIRPIARLVFYNALLQGGILSNYTKGNTFYQIEKDKIERMTFLYEIEFSLKIQRYSLALKQKLHTSEFEGAYAQETGNITMRWRF